MSIPRPEYPRPQFRRNDWQCLNGEWQFEIDKSDSGLERGLRERELEQKITVPFCPESSLSGIEHVDFMEAVWYRREIEIPKEWAGNAVHLIFQAVDYETTVWVNGEELVRHRGGFTPFYCDLTRVAQPGERVIVVLRARDQQGMAKPGGKQSWHYANAGCLYTRTTGIWQTVWMEPVPEAHLKRPRVTPDLAASRFRLEQPLSNNTRGYRVRAILKDDKGEVCRAEISAEKDFAPSLDLVVPEDRLQLWQPGEAFLYDIEIDLLDADGQVVDHAESYAGMRSIAIDGPAVKINGRSVFQRQVLDQGYYPDGIMTAPSDEALKRDIEISMAAGFNSARLHQKLFEERFLYHADRMGYLVWGEYGDWGFRDGSMGEPYYHQPFAAIMSQWLEALERDYSHPSIIGWCPLNESGQAIEDRMTALDDVTRGLFLATKAMDLSRPVLDASGYSHRVYETDVYDCHDYNQDAEGFAKNHAGCREGKPFINQFRKGRDGKPQEENLPYAGQPYFVSEFGGIWWNPDAKEDEYSWGYGNRPKSVEEFYERFEALCNVLLDDPGMFGYCYTQLTDVFQEQNGIVRFNRDIKFDMDKLHAIQSRRAAIED
ncbi:MAG: glycoside hydrolase family 2 protein [Candidatus Sumerlaeia bacterium]